MEKRMLMVETPKPHSQPLLSSIHTTNVTAISAPNERQKTKQLKKVDLCFLPCGVFSSNCSAPCDGSDPFIPPTPRAVRQRPKNSIAAFPPLTSWQIMLRSAGSHAGGCRETDRACTVSITNPCFSSCKLVTKILFNFWWSHRARVEPHKTPGLYLPRQGLLHVV